MYKITDDCYFLDKNELPRGVRSLFYGAQGKLADIAQRHLGSGLTLEKALLEAWCLGFNCNDE